MPADATTAAATPTGNTFLRFIFNLSLVHGQSSSTDGR
jgi:hypothetical protein